MQYIAGNAQLKSRKLTASAAILNTNISVTENLNMITIVAQENIPAFTLVTSTGYKADATNLAHRGKVVGMTLAAIAATFSGQVQTEGRITNPDWNWTNGDDLFLSGDILSNSAMVVAPAVFTQQAGMAISATTIVLEIQEPYLL